MNIFGKNLRFLRKKAGWSQGALADRLGIKRSNIAAYESKNVEPRLNLLIEIAKTLNVDLLLLIKEDLTTYQDILPFQILPKNVGFLDSELIDIQSKRQSLKTFTEKTQKIKKVLEGFKSFYKFKLETMAKKSGESLKTMIEIENFLQLTDYVISHNEQMIQALSRKND